MIMRVVRDGPAGKAGIVVEDILVTLDGQGVSRPLMVTERLGPESIDRPVQLRLIRAGQGRRAGRCRRRATIQLNPALDRLRVAVAAVDLPARKRLASLVEQSGHEVVELEGCPDAVLSDGAEGTVLAVPTVAVGSDEHEFPGLLPTGATARQIDVALRAVAAGLTVRVPGLRNRTFGVPTEDLGPLLTPREVEVLQALSDNLSNKAAGSRLGISPYSVKFHIEWLFRRLGARSRAEVVAKGLKRGLFEV
jgi:DNA-binding CsgD family transcriptional regulator